MSIISILLGIVLLFFGRSLYWAFVAIAGFLVGFEIAAELLIQQPDSVRILVALAGGILGAILGMFAQRIAFSVGGLFAGSYLAMNLDEVAKLPGDPMVWSIVGGIIGAIVAALLLDWAIIILSSLAGAAAVVTELQLGSGANLLLFIVLIAVGISVQARRLRYSPKERS